MNKITRKISEWHAAGLIDKQQQEKLLNYEQTQHSEPYRHKLIILGIVIISLGCCSLVSAHWHSISEHTKLAVNLLFDTLFIGLTFYYRHHNKPKRADFYRLLSMLLFFTTILLGQDYLNIQLRVDALFLTWSLSCLPLVIGTQMTFSIYLWLAGILFGGYIKLADISDQLLYNPLTMYVIPPLICLIIGLLAFKEKRPINWTHAFLFYGTLTAIGIVSYIDLNHAIYESQRFIPTNYLAAYLLSIIFIVLLKSIKTVEKPISMLCYSAILIYTIDYTSSHIFVSTLYFSILTLAFFFNIALILFLHDETAYYNIVLSLIALRLIALFSQSIGGWFKSGIGLILTGIIMILFVSYGKKILDCINHKLALVIQKRT